LVQVTPSSRGDAAESALPADVTGAAETLEGPNAADLLPPGSARNQLFAAYAAAGAKVVAWVVAAAVVYRMMGPGPFALFMLLRGTVALLNHTTFGLGPAVLHFVLRAPANNPALAAEVVDHQLSHASAPPTLAYAGRLSGRVILRPGETPANVLLHAFWLTLGLGLCATIAVVAYEDWFPALHSIPKGVLQGDLAAIVLLGLGTLLRAVGDVAGGFNQARGRLALDSSTSAICDLLWGVLCLSILYRGPVPFLDEVASAYLLTGAVAAGARWLLAWTLAMADAPAYAIRPRHQFGYRFYRRLLAFGGLVTLGSVADWLYAPIDFIILNRLVDPLAVAVYAPAVQIDAALILLVNAIAAVILPRSALRHAAADHAGVWREYVRGALGAAGITLVGALLAWGLSRWIFKLWLGNEMAATQAILPLVLLHTILGSSGGVGRSTMLAMGKAGTYAASVLAGGLLNIGLSLALVYAGWGLVGVVLGTVISVTIRCLFWMPWYIRRSLGRPSLP
jgi:O-antigen/teichoic acid export membrane protein